jgi:hypothetical protein
VELGRVAVGTCEGANFEGVRLWTERNARDVLTVPAVVVLDRKRDRKDTHVVVPEGFVPFSGPTPGSPPWFKLPLPDDEDGVAHVLVDGPGSRSQSQSSSAGVVTDPLEFTTW